ncbi:hypothetical protein Cgig2_003247 [Carnegiea gigantea]|uniref:Uncharacterized protein n=1 Tax=Carnegiea gigantea TaxID=171969 RepID=A0A9Q1JUW3_9CARY|nr:hypothetical protein Cgig2_003247 [Carnegiea gigantea]
MLLQLHRTTLLKNFLVGNSSSWVCGWSHANDYSRKRILLRSIQVSCLGLKCSTILQDEMNVSPTFPETVVVEAPNGFYKKGWQVVVDDVCHVVLCFFKNGKPLKRVNNILITLVANKPNLEILLWSMQPIRCWNFRQDLGGMLTNARGTLKQLGALRLVFSLFGKSI